MRSPVASFLFIQLPLKGMPHEGFAKKFFPKTGEGWVMPAPKKGDRRLSKKEQASLNFTIQYLSWLWLQLTVVEKCNSQFCKDR